MNIEDEKIAPCPFCGDPPVIRRSMEEYAADGEHPAGEYESHVCVCCGTCGIEMVEEYRSDAIAAWNRRSPSPAAKPSVTEGVGRPVEAALALLRMIDDEIKRVADAPDPVVKHNLGYYAERLRAALESALAASPQVPVGEVVETQQSIGAKREWKSDGTGHGYHVKPAAPVSVPGEVVGVKPAETGDRQFALTAASQAFYNRGIEIPVPWEGDLDDQERERFEAMVAAIDAYNETLAISPAPQGREEVIEEVAAAIEKLWHDSMDYPSYPETIEAIRSLSSPSNDKTGDA